MRRVDKVTSLLLLTAMSEWPTTLWRVICCVDLTDQSQHAFVLRVREGLIAGVHDLDADRALVDVPRPSPKRLATVVAAVALVRELEHVPVDIHEM